MKHSCSDTDTSDENQWPVSCKPVVGQVFTTPESTWKDMTFNPACAASESVLAVVRQTMLLCQRCVKSSRYTKFNMFC